MSRFIPVFSISLFLSLALGLLLYINSSFLGQFFSPPTVSFIFVIGALGNATLYYFSPRLLNSLGKARLLALFIAILFISSLGMAYATIAGVALVMFVSYSSVLYMTYYCLDIFLEELSIDKHTGELRGFYGTVINGGIMAGPIMLTMIGLNESLDQAYFIASFLLIIPMILSFVLLFKHRRDHRSHEHIRLPFKPWWRSSSIRRVTLAKLTLEAFFALMVIYTPLYLHNELGFAWQELGIIFTVALLPFVLFEWPVGELADRLWGEKELMTLGFFITGTTLFIMPFLGKVFLVWMALLFLSRVGASIVEITTESYFFKQVDASDTGLISIYRLARPAGLIFGAVLGAITLQIFAFPALFFIVAFIVFLGIRESIYLKDTL